MKEQVNQFLATLKDEEVEVKALAAGQPQTLQTRTRQRTSFKRCESRPANTLKGLRNIGKRLATKLFALTALSMCSLRPWTASSVW